MTENKVFPSYMGQAQVQTCDYSVVKETSS